jgi:hypothetical protein
MFLYVFELAADDSPFSREITVQADRESEAAVMVAAAFDGGDFARCVRVEVESDDSPF